MRKLRRLLLFLFSIAIAVFLCEGLVRLLGLGSRGTIGHLYEANPVVGWSHRPSAQTEHVSDEFNIKWRFNEEGIRRNEEVTPDPSRSPIVVLGDSHTAGHGVEAEETFSHALEQDLSSEFGSAQVLNFGVDGYSTSQEWAWLKEQAERWNPRGVVVGFYPGNDFRENLEPRGLGGYSRPLFDSELRLVLDPRIAYEQSSNRSLLSRMKSTLSEHSHLYLFVGNSVKGSPLHRWFSKMGLMNAPPAKVVNRVVERCHGGFAQLLWGIDTLEEKRAEGALEVTTSLLYSIHKWCEERSVRCLIVMIPCRILVEGNREGVDEAAAWMGIPKKPDAILLELMETLVTRLEARGVQVLDLLPAAKSLKKSSDTLLYFANDWHLNATGHAFVASQIRNRIVQERWY